MHASGGDGSQAVAAAVATAPAGVPFSPAGSRLRVLSFNVNGLRACLKRLRLKTMSQLLDQLNAGKLGARCGARTSSAVTGASVQHWHRALPPGGLPWLRAPSSWNSWELNHVFTQRCLAPQTLCAFRRRSCGGAMWTLSWHASRAGGLQGGGRALTLPGETCAYGRAEVSWQALAGRRSPVAVPSHLPSHASPSFIQPLPNPKPLYIPSRDSFFCCDTTSSTGYSGTATYCRTEAALPFAAEEGFTGCAALAAAGGQATTGHPPRLHVPVAIRRHGALRALCKGPAA